MKISARINTDLIMLIVHFCRMHENGLVDAWIGLRKMEYICKSNTDSDILACNRKDWTWQDGAEYTYPAWHNWEELEPEWNEQCARLNLTEGWAGTQCTHNYQYLCEKGNVIIIYHKTFL